MRLLIVLPLLALLAACAGSQAPQPQALEYQPAPPALVQDDQDTAPQATWTTVCNTGKNHDCGVQLSVGDKDNWLVTYTTYEPGLLSIAFGVPLGAKRGQPLLLSLDGRSVGAVRLDYPSDKQLLAMWDLTEGQRRAVLAGTSLEVAYAGRTYIVPLRGLPAALARLAPRQANSR